MEPVIDIKLLNEFAKVPTRGSEDAAGYDLYAATDGPVRIPAHRTILIGTGLSMSLPKGTFLGIYPRSGLAAKQGLRPANCVGVVDSDYRGEIKVALHNDTDIDRDISAGERIAQGILHTYVPMHFEVVDELDETKRGAGGFGSTGK